MKLLSASNNYRKFISSFPNITLTNLDVANSYIDIHHKILELEELAKTYIMKASNNHFTTCIKSDPYLENVPDTCMCDIIEWLYFEIESGIYKLFKSGGNTI